MDTGCLIGMAYLIRKPLILFTGALGLAASMTVLAAHDGVNKGYPAAGKSVTVTIDAFQFQPDKIRIRRGQSVIFINKDEVPHTVTPDKTAHFGSSGIIKGGEQHEVLFTSAGVQNYACDFHPSMRGKVIVK